MARFHAIVMAAAIGAALGSWLRPSLPEIAIAALAVVAGMTVYRQIMSRRLAWLD